MNDQVNIARKWMLICQLQMTPENFISKDFVKLLTIKANGKTRRFDRA